MSPITRFYVYTHSRLDTGEVFYVGKGCGRRAHAKSGRSAQWARTVAKHGLTVSIVGEDLSEAEAFAIEVEMIAALSPSCNHTSGGEGLSGYHHTAETRAALSQAHSGRRQERAVVEARTIKLRGQKRSDDFCRRVGDLHRGRTHSDVTRAKMSESHTGKRRSASAIAATADRHRGMTRSDEARANMSAAQPQRAVICCSTGERFSSLTAAAAWLRATTHPKATKTGIWQSARGAREMSYGYRWVYAE